MAAAVDDGRWKSYTRLLCRSCCVGALMKQTAVNNACHLSSVFTEPTFN